jgi:hypothetical protein
MMAGMQVAEGLRRLTEVLPLCERKASLPSRLAEIHSSILAGFATVGRPPEIDTDDALTLAALDLVVVDERQALVGAYPFSLEPTPHLVRLPRADVWAMCSLDALSVAPVFRTETKIESTCAVTGRPIEIEQRGALLTGADPPTPWVGIHWQQPCDSAARSLCREMVFLSDEETASAWGVGGDSTFTCDLPSGIEFALEFFGPLV